MPGRYQCARRRPSTSAMGSGENTLSGAAFIGTVGLDWQFAGIAAANGAGTSDLVLRNVNSGAFEVYDIANNQLTGAASLGSVGLDWQVAGIAADPPTGSTGNADGSTSQLQWRRRELEHCHCQRRDITAAIADDPAARLANRPSARTSSRDVVAGGGSGRDENARVEPRAAGPELARRLSRTSLWPNPTSQTAPPPAIQGERLL